MHVDKIKNLLFSPFCHRILFSCFLTCTGAGVVGKVDCVVVVGGVGVVVVLLEAVDLVVLPVVVFIVVVATVIGDSTLSTIIIIIKSGRTDNS